MNKYEKIKTSKLLDLLTTAPDEEVSDIILEVQDRLGLGYYEELVEELRGEVKILENQIKTLEFRFKNHRHIGAKVYIEAT